MTNETRTRVWTGRAVCMGVYLAAGVAAVIAGWLVRHQHPLIVVAVADAAGTLAVFSFTLTFRNSSLYDPYWSVAPICIVVFWFMWPGNTPQAEPRRWIAGLLVALWGLRLTYNWLRGWRGLRHEDWRYVDLRHSTGRSYWLVSVTGIHYFPTVLVYLGCLPLMPAMWSGTRPLNLVDAVACFVTASAIVLESVADRQLYHFVRQRTDDRALLDAGLWSFSRHPNYLGEVTFWWGLLLFGLAADPRAWWTGIGAVVITLLFVYTSIPLIEKRHLARRTGYSVYRQTTPMLVPWFRRRTPRGSRGGPMN